MKETIRHYIKSILVAIVVGVVATVLSLLTVYALGVDIFEFIPKVACACPPK